MDGHYLESTIVVSINASGHSVYKSSRASPTTWRKSATATPLITTESRQKPAYYLSVLLRMAQHRYSKALSHYRSPGTFNRRDKRMPVMSESSAVTSLQKVRLVRGIAVLTTLGLLGLSASLVWAALSTAAGLAALAGLAIIGAGTFQALPLFMQKLENRVLQVRKAEARANPIEQLQNEVFRRAGRLQSFRQALVTVAGQIETINALMENCQHRDPTHVLERQQRALHKLQQFHRVNLARLAKAQAALEEFRSTVERKSSEWCIALAIGEVSELLDPTASDNLMQELLTDTALHRVQERFNTCHVSIPTGRSRKSSGLCATHW